MAQKHRQTHTHRIKKNKNFNHQISVIYEIYESFINCDYDWNNVMWWTWGYEWEQEGEKQIFFSVTFIYTHTDIT